MKNKYFFLGIMLMLMLLPTQLVFAQDKVYLKADHSFKLDGRVVYEGKANEAFRLRELGSTLKVELPDSTVVDLKRSLVAESKDYLTVIRDCHVYSSSWGARIAPDPQSEEYRMGSLKAGTDVLNKASYHGAYKVKTPEGETGYVAAADVMPNLQYAVFYYRRNTYLYDIKDPVKEELKLKTDNNGKVITKTHLAKADEKLIVAGQMGEFTKLRKLDGREGWVKTSEIAQDGYTEYGRWPWLYRIMLGITVWGSSNWFFGLVAIAIFALCLGLYVSIPVGLLHYVLARFKLLPNWICKVLIWTVPLPFFLITGLSLLEYPPFDLGSWKVPFSIAAVLYILAAAYYSFTYFSGEITSERCPKCHSLSNYNELDSYDSHHTETTTTTTTYSSGYQTKKDDVQNYTITHTLKECNRCGRQWWA